MAAYDANTERHLNAQTRQGNTRHDRDGRG
jgi:hypothetical protein